MGCFTIFTDKAGKDCSVGTERYVSGTYLALNIGGQLIQASTHKRHRKYFAYHSYIRTKIIKDGGKVDEEKSTPLDICKQADEKFEKENSEYL